VAGVVTGPALWEWQLLTPLAFFTLVLPRGFFFDCD